MSDAIRKFHTLPLDEQNARVASIFGIEDEPAHDYCRKCGCADITPHGIGLAPDHVCPPPAPAKKARRRR